MSFFSTSALGSFQSKDRFSRPSPNLAKRLAQQAENDAKRARIYDDQERITEHERQEILRLKAERYEKLRKGEEAPSKESAIDVSRSETASSLVASVYSRMVYSARGTTCRSRFGDLSG